MNTHHPEPSDAEARWLADVSQRLTQAVPPMDVEGTWALFQARLAQQAVPQQEALGAPAAVKAAANAAPLPAPVSRPVKRPVKRPGAPSVWARWLQSVRSLFVDPSANRGGMGSLGMAFVLGIMLAAPIGFWSGALSGFDDGKAAGLEALGQASSPNGVAPALVLDVVFAETMSVAELRLVLDRVGGQVLAGPSPLGLWQVGFAHADQAKALAAVQREPGVVNAAVRVVP